MTLAIFLFPICSTSIGFDCVHRRLIIAFPFVFRYYFCFFENIPLSLSKNKQLWIKRTSATR